MPLGDQEYRTSGRLIMSERGSTLWLEAIPGAVMVAAAVVLLRGIASGWFALVIAVPASVVAIYDILHPPSLTLNAYGMAWSLIGGRERLLRWDEVTEFGVRRMGRADFFRRRVTFELVAPEGAGPVSALRRGQRLPRSFGYKPVELASLLNTWRTRAIGEE